MLIHSIIFYLSILHLLVYALTTIPVCGIPRSAYLPLNLNLNFTSNTVYQFGCNAPVCDNPYHPLGLVDPNPWTYGTYKGGAGLSFITSGGSPDGCATGSGSARVVLHCDPIGDGFSEVIDVTPCTCKN